MKTLTIFLFLSIATLPAWGKDLTLTLGETQGIPLKGSAQVWIQDSQILQADSTGGRVSLKGRHEGQTTARIGNELFRVQVVHPAKKEIFKNLQDSLRSFVGLQAEITDGDLLVTGRLYRFEEWLRLAEVIRGTSINYQMRASMSEPLQKEIQKYFNELFEKAKIPPQSVIFEPAPEVRVTGSALALKKYISLLRPFGIQVIKDEQSLDIAPTVKVQITVAEVDRDFRVAHGVQWPESYKATIFGSGGASLSDFELFIRANESNGKSKILASPNLLCRSGNEAEFLVGGEIPIKIINYEVHDIVWKRYGILLKVKPKADAAGRISLSIDTEISKLDMAHKVDDIPGVLTNRVSSHFDLTGSQTIALSGLIKNEDSKNSSGIPGISSIPILGALFGSKDFAENRSELVIFVRPSIMKAGEEMDSPEHVGEI